MTTAELTLEYFKTDAIKYIVITVCVLFLLTFVYFYFIKENTKHNKKPCVTDVLLDAKEELKT